MLQGLAPKDIIKIEEDAAAEAFLKQVGIIFCKNKNFADVCVHRLTTSPWQHASTVLRLAFHGLIVSDGLSTKCAGKWACLHWL